MLAIYGPILTACDDRSCKFRTFRGSATPGLAGAPGSEYEITYEWAAGGLDGEILFGPGEMLKDIMIDVFDSESFKKSEVFYVQLVDPQNCDLRNLTVARCTIVEDRAVQRFATDVVIELAESAKSVALLNRYAPQSASMVFRGMSLLFAPVYHADTAANACGVLVPFRYCSLSLHSSKYVLSHWRLLCFLP